MPGHHRHPGWRSGREHVEVPDRPHRQQTKIEVIYHSAVRELDGVSGLERVVVEDLTTTARQTLPASALFVLIGAEPHTHWLAGSIELDSHGSSSPAQNSAGKLVGGLPGRSRPAILSCWRPACLACSPPGTCASARSSGCLGRRRRLHRRPVRQRAPRPPRRPCSRRWPLSPLAARREKLTGAEIRIRRGSAAE
jgi:hypothetical protein